MVVESPLDDLLHRYATPAFHLEISGDRTQVKSALLSRPWVQGVVEEAGGLRIIASDLQEAQRSIASLLAAEHVSLLEFATVVPTLEDVFLRLTGRAMREGESPGNPMNKRWLWRRES